MKPHRNTIDRIRKPVNQLSLFGDFIKSFPSSVAAAKELELDSSHIRKCCKGLRKSHGGFRWQYVPNYTPLPLEPTRTGRVKLAEK